MNELTQTRLAWVLSASLLAAGWLSRYLPETGSDDGLSCSESAPRAVAVVLPETANRAEGERVYVYWLDSPHPEGPRERLVRSVSTTSKGSPPGAESGWKLVGSTVLDGPKSGDPLPIR